MTVYICCESKNFFSEEFEICHVTRNLQYALNWVEEDMANRYFLQKELE